MHHGRVCLFTQTPYTRLLRETDHGPGAPLDLAGLTEGVDHLPSPGGVTRMIRALLAHWEATRRVTHATWISLAAAPAPSLRLGARSTIHHVSLPPAQQAAYAQAKGAFWNVLHGLAEDADLAAVDAGLSHLARAMAAAAAREHARAPFDVFYVHDFQLMRLAPYLPRRVPAAFRWHGPVRPMPPRIEAYLASCLNQYGAVVVHTEGHARELRRMGVSRPIHVSHPYVPDAPRVALTRHDLDAFDAKHGLSREDVVFTLVARLDPIKSQDVAIRALARIRDDAPDARLLLVGGGGFSGGRGGLGMGHAASWRVELERLAQELGVADRVVFTGGILDGDLEVAYARSRAVLLPSCVEGFGLAPVEAWQRRVPVVVSQGAGVAALVREAENGFTFAPGDEEALARAMLLLAKDAPRAVRMGNAGSETARLCTVERASLDVGRVLEGLARSPARPTLVTDLDRTLTGPDLVLDERVRSMLRALRDAGVRVVLATGRPLLHVVQMGLHDLTDALVAENGAIVVDNRTRETQVLDESFRTRAEAALGDLAPRFSWHRVMGSGPRHLAAEVQARLLAAGVEHNVEFNAQDVMVLPAGVDKGTGALAALRMLGADSRDVWAIGDGENDVALFRIARESAAPAQAEARVASQATMALTGAYAEAFLQFARRLLRDPSPSATRAA